MTSDAVYRCAISSHKALRTLYARKDEEFQAGLIEQFIQCIGVYPVGSLVELTTGEVGVVLSQNRVRRLRPEIMLILDEHKKAIESGAVIDLMKELSDSSGNPLEIKDVLEPGAYGKRSPIRTMNAITAVGIPGNLRVNKYRSSARWPPLSIVTTR